MSNPQEAAIEVDVLIIGAGPTGLAMAVEALRHGLSCRIIESKSSRLLNQSKALILHARTLEQLQAMGDGRVVNALVEEGMKMKSLKAFIGKRKVGRLHEFDECDEHCGDTTFPFWLNVPQHRTECILEQELVRLGGKVEWSTCLKTLQTVEAPFVDDGNGNFNDIIDINIGGPVRALIDRAGHNEIIQCKWAIGCDGGRSLTRDQAGLKLDRESWNEFFYLADFELGSNESKEFFKKMKEIYSSTPMALWQCSVSARVGRMEKVIYSV